MVASMNYTIQSEVTIPLNPESDPASEQRSSSGNESTGRNERNEADVPPASLTGHTGLSRQARNTVWRFILKLSKKDIIIAILAVLLMITLGVIIFSSAQKKQPEARSTPKPFLTTSCSQGWTPHADFCYFFSDTDSTWDFSLSNCSSYNASLLGMDTQEEMTFINNNKASYEYWLGHRRKAVGESWKKPDGSDSEVWFPIKGEGLCASLNDGVVSSTGCNSQRRWICVRPRHGV